MIIIVYNTRVMRYYFMQVKTKKNVAYYDIHARVYKKTV